MSNLETKLATFYNFKDESTCKLCSLVDEFDSIGGSELVAKKLGVILENGFEHVQQPVSACLQENLELHKA